MADFSTPFAATAERRSPTTDEKNNGFPCGPADMRLFNGLFHRLEAEVGEVIDFAGITQTDDRFTLLREAIEALISVATGGGDTSQFLLMAQARARLPIFPEVSTVSGKFTVTSTGVGNVRLGGGTAFVHRGIFNLTSAQTDFATDASKTYHLRWNPTDGFTLKDLASPVYNPGTLAETATAFDSTYDDMLVARCVSNSSNVLTITPLVNKDRHEIIGNVPISATELVGSASTLVTLDLARKPKIALSLMEAIADTSTLAPNGFTDEFSYGFQSLNRYTVAAIYRRYGLLGEGSVAHYIAWL